MKKSLGALILSFLLFGSVTANPTSGMELRSVLDNDLSKTLAGEVVRTKRATEDEVRKVANEVKVQYRTNENGTYDVRFVAGISSLDLSKATFNVTINNGDKSATKNYDVTHAYTSVMSGENVLSAVEVFGEGYDYLVAYAIIGIPEKAITYTYNVNVSISIDETVLDTSDTRTLVLKDIISPEEKLPDFSDDIIPADTTTTVAIDKEVSHDGVQSLKVTGIPTTNSSLYSNAQYKGDYDFGEGSKITFYVKFNGFVRNNRIAFRIETTDGTKIDRHLELYDSATNDQGLTYYKVENNWFYVELDVDTFVNTIYKVDGVVNPFVATNRTLKMLRFGIQSNDRGENAVNVPSFWIDELNIYNSSNPSAPVKPETPVMNDLSDQMSTGENASISVDTEVSHDGVSSVKVTGSSYSETNYASLAFYYPKEITMCDDLVISFYVKLDGTNIYKNRINLRLHAKDGNRIEPQVILDSSSQPAGITSSSADANGWYKVVINCNDLSTSLSGKQLDYLRVSFEPADKNDTNKTIVPIIWIDELYFG